MSRWRGGWSGVVRTQISSRQDCGALIVGGKNDTENELQ